METNQILIYVVSPILTAIIGGVGYLVKRYLKKQEEQIAERNKRREKIENDIEELKRDVTDVQSIIIGCEHPDCPSRSLLSAWLKNRKNNQ